MARTSGTKVGRAALAVALVFAAFAAGIGYGIAAAIVVAAVGWARSDRAAQRRRARHQRHARHARAERRESQLELAGVPRTEMDELTALVDIARRMGSPEVHHAELDDLLDAYADTSVAAHLAAAAPLHVAGDGTAAAAVGIRSRAWRLRTAALGERRDELAQLIRLYTARALLPEIEHLLDDGVFARCLAQLDAGVREA